MNRDQLKAELSRDEGYKLTAYRDTAVPPNWTIGIGHLLGASPRMSDITPAECDALYQFDVAQAEALSRSVVPGFDQLTDDQQRALVNMSFNRGDHMRTSTTIVPAINQAIASGQARDWAAVMKAIVASPWATQVGARAQRIGQMLSGLTA